MLFVFYVYLEYNKPAADYWIVTFNKNDRNPYGGYALNELLETSWFEKYTHSYETAYELVNKEKSNLLIVSDFIEIDRTDAEAIENAVDSGATVFIAGQYVYSSWLDSLQINFQRTDSDLNIDLTYQQKIDSVTISYDGNYSFPELFISSRIEDEEGRLNALIKGNNDEIFLAELPIGEGKIILCSIPLIFSNLSLVNGDNHQLVADVLSLLPAEQIEWTEYYKMGRMESGSFFRFLLSKESLRWALYLSLLFIVLFMLFEAKRKQRVIPIITPLQNNTLDFIKHISRIHLSKNDNDTIVKRKLLFFSDKLKEDYRLELAQATAEDLVNLRGFTELQAQYLLNFYKSRDSLRNVTDEDLKKINYLIDLDRK